MLTKRKKALFATVTDYLEYSRITGQILKPTSMFRMVYTGRGKSRLIARKNMKNERDILLCLQSVHWVNQSVKAMCKMSFF